MKQIAYVINLRDQTVVDTRMLVDGMIPNALADETQAAANDHGESFAIAVGLMFFEPIPADARRVFEGIMCPGCDVQITIDNAGGYRNYCEECVAVMPQLPHLHAPHGWTLHGRRGSFHWEAAE